MNSVASQPALFVRLTPSRGSRRTSGQDVDVRCPKRLVNTSRSRAKRRPLIHAIRGVQHRTGAWPPGALQIGVPVRQGINYPVVEWRTVPACVGLGTILSHRMISMQRNAPANMCAGRSSCQASMLSFRRPTSTMAVRRFSHMAHHEGTGRSLVVRYVLPLLAMPWRFSR